MAHEAVGRDRDRGGAGRAEHAGYEAVPWQAGRRIDTADLTEDVLEVDEGVTDGAAEVLRFPGGRDLPQVYRGGFVLGHEFSGLSHVDVALTPDDAAAQLSSADPAALEVDVVLECSGSAAATKLALQALRPGGVLVVVGAGPGSGLDPMTILLKEITVHGSFTYIDEFDDAIELLAAGKIEIADLTTAVAPLDQALGAIESLRAAHTMKVLVDPHA
jgi:SAM-dependent methyltransferase